MRLDRAHRPAVCEGHLSSISPSMMTGFRPWNSLANRLVLMFWWGTLSMSQRFRGIDLLRLRRVGGMARHRDAGTVRRGEYG